MVELLNELSNAIPLSPAFSILAWLLACLALALAYWLHQKTRILPATLFLAAGVGLATFPLMPIVKRSAGLFPFSKDQVFFQADLLRQSVIAEDMAKDPRRLLKHEATVFSQHGEDGILAEIFRRVGTTNRYFVEFGSGDGQRNNTVFLLMQGWSGLWIDGAEDLVNAAGEAFAREIDEGRLTVKHSFITAENIEEIFRSAEVPVALDLLSIDIDRNDYWVWKAIRSFNPRVVVVEYNAIFSPAMFWVVDYEPSSWWDGSSHFGASLLALERLGDEKGYALVGCNSTGINAFFVRKDLLGDKFAGPYTAANHYQPPRYLLRLYQGGHPRRVAAPARRDDTE